MTPPVRSFSHMHWEQVPLGRLSRLHIHAMHFKTRDNMRQRYRRERSRSGGNTAGWKPRKGAAGRGEYLMSIIWKGEGGMDVAPEGLHGGDRKTFWIGGTMVITVSI